MNFKVWKKQITAQVFHHGLCFMFCSTFTTNSEYSPKQHYGLNNLTYIWTSNICTMLGQVMLPDSAALEWANLRVYPPVFKIFRLR